jgi:hypothetical protein
MKKTKTTEKQEFIDFFEPENDETSEFDLEELKNAKKLDIFELLGNIDAGNKYFYSDLPPEKKKAFAPVVAIRWLSALQNNGKYGSYYLTTTNEVVNKHFWALSTNHPELIYKLMAAVGLGVKQKHGWIAGTKKTKLSKVDEFFLQWYPDSNEIELEILKSGMDKDGFEQFVKGTGATDEQLKELIKAYEAEEGLSQG